MSLLAIWPNLEIVHGTGRLIKAITERCSLAEKLINRKHCRLAAMDEHALEIWDRHCGTVHIHLCMHSVPFGASANETWTNRIHIEGININRIDDLH